MKSSSVSSHLPKEIMMENKKNKSFWGKGIVIFYLLFMLGMFSLIKAATTANLDLVDDSYYTNSEKYQEVIEAKKRTALLSKKPEIALNNKNIIISLPDSFAENIKAGNVLIYSPSSAREDINVRPDFRSNLIFTYPVTNLRKGVWDVSFTWQNKSGDSYILTKRIEIR